MKFKELVFQIAAVEDRDALFEALEDIVAAYYAHHTITEAEFKALYKLREHATSYVWEKGRLEELNAIVDTPV